MKGSLILRFNWLEWFIDPRVLVTFFIVVAKHYGQGSRGLESTTITAGSIGADRQI